MLKLISVRGMYTLYDITSSKSKSQTFCIRYNNQEYFRIFKHSGHVITEVLKDTNTLSQADSVCLADLQKMATDILFKLN